jgi:uncharacterized RDD family membrane protein YckC
VWVCSQCGRHVPRQVERCRCGCLPPLAANSPTIEPQPRRKGYAWIYDKHDPQATPFGFIIAIVGVFSLVAVSHDGTGSLGVGFALLGIGILIARERLVRVMTRMKRALGTIMLVLGIGVIVTALPGVLRYVFSGGYDFESHEGFLAIGAMMVASGLFVRRSGEDRGAEPEVTQTRSGDRVASTQAVQPASAAGCGAWSPRTSTTTTVSAGQQTWAGPVEFWLRVCALFVDLTIILPINIACVGLISHVIGLHAPDGDFYSLWYVTLSFIAWIYQATMESSARQATVGKAALGLIVTDMEGGRLTFGHATVRYLLKVLNIWTFGIGFLAAGVTAKKQALHDVLARTLVVKKQDARVATIR